MSRRKKTSLPQPVQEQLKRIAMPRALIPLDDRAIDIIARYRKAKQALSEAMDTAIANQDPGTLLWTDSDREAFAEADKALRHCQIEMCALLDISASVAGV